MNLDLLVHAWDFAKAIGLALTVSAAVTDYVAELARLIISDQLRANGRSAAAPPVAETASSLKRLIAFTGRTIAA